MKKVRMGKLARDVASVANAVAVAGAIVGAAHVMRETAERVLVAAQAVAVAVADYEDARTAYEAARTRAARGDVATLDAATLDCAARVDVAFAVYDAALASETAAYDVYVGAREARRRFDESVVEDPLGKGQCLDAVELLDHEGRDV